MNENNIVGESDLLRVEEAEYRKLVESRILKPSLLQESLGDKRVRCNVCQRRCVIPDGRAGYCQTRINAGGTIYTTTYGVVSSAAADPIEKKPVYHFKPGSQVYSVGSLGCNFRCMFCQNWQISFADAVSPSNLCHYGFTPEDLVRIARESGCQGIAWTYNEPSIWLEYTLDSAKLAKASGLYTVYVTNGYATEEHLDAIGPYLDVYRVDIKSMSSAFYRELIKVPSVDGVLATAKRAKEKWNMHVECITNIIPSWNDSESELTQIAEWIRDNLGDLTPWHVTRFFPYAEMQDVPPTPPETLFGAAKIGKDRGLKFVYTGNLATETGQNTYCYTDGTLAVERTHYRTKVLGVSPEGECATDGTDLNIVM